MSKGMESKILMTIMTLIAILFLLAFFTGFFPKLLHFLGTAMMIVSNKFAKEIAALLNPFG